METNGEAQFTEGKAVIGIVESLLGGERFQARQVGFQRTGSRSV